MALVRDHDPSEAVEVAALREAVHLHHAADQELSQCRRRPQQAAPRAAVNLHDGTGRFQGAAAAGGRPRRGSSRVDDGGGPRGQAVGIVGVVDTPDVKGPVPEAARHDELAVAGEASRRYRAGDEGNGHGQQGFRVLRVGRG